jgi:hypothetical protein
MAASSSSPAPPYPFPSSLLLSLSKSPWLMCAGQIARAPNGNGGLFAGTRVWCLVGRSSCAAQGRLITLQRWRRRAHSTTWSAAASRMCVMSFLVFFSPLRLSLVCLLADAARTPGVHVLCGQCARESRGSGLYWLLCLTARRLRCESLSEGFLLSRSILPLLSHQAGRAR